MSKNYGDKSNNFNNKGIVSDKALATVLLRVLEYPETEFTWKTAVDVLKAKTGIEIAGDKLTRGEAFEAIWKAVSTPVMFVKDGEAPKYLGVEVGKLDIAIITPPVKDLAIDSVSADNLKEIKVNFNQPVNKDKLGNFSIKEAAANTLTAELLEDGMTVKLTAKDALKDGKTYTLVAKDTEAVDEKGGKLAEVSKEIAAFDGTRPEVVKVEVAGPLSVVVTFNEPIKDGTGKVTIKQGKVTIPTNSKIQITDNKAVISLYSKLVEEKEYKITVEEFKDYGEQNNVYYELNLTVAKDTETPTITVVEANETYYILQFSKLVTGLKPEYFHHTRNAISADSITSVDGKTNVTDKSEVTKVKVHFTGANNPLADGQVKIMVDGGKISDLWGNKIKDDFVAYGNVTADLVRPTVEKVEATKETQITVTFSEEIAPKTNAATSFVVKNKDGNSVYAGAVENGKNAKQWDITLAGTKAGEEVTVTVKDIVDKSVNKNTLTPSHEEKVMLLDKTPPKVTELTYVLIEEGAVVKGGKIYVHFDETLDLATALEADNYKIKNAAGTFEYLPADGNQYLSANIVEFAIGEKLAKEIKAKEGSLTNGDFNILVEKVADIKGNAMDPTVVAKTYKKLAEFAKVQVLEAKATAVDTVVVKFNQDIYDVKKEKIKFDAKDVENYSINGDTVTFKLKANLAVDYAGASNMTFADAEALLGSLTDGKYSNDNAAKVFADAIRPTIVSIAQDGVSPRLLKVTFTENLAANAVSASIAQDITVYHGDKALTIEADEVAFEVPGGSAQLNITLKGTKYYDGKDFKVVVNKDAKYVKDAQGNVVLPLPADKQKKLAVADYDLVGPTFTLDDAATNDATTFTIVLEEGTKLNNDGAINNSVDIKAGFNADAGVGITSATTDAAYTTGTRKVVFVITGAADGKKVIANATTPLKDAKGNVMVGPIVKFNGTTNKWEIVE